MQLISLMLSRVMRYRKKFHAMPLLLALFIAYFGACLPVSGVNAADNCDPLGWFPSGYGLKDHTVFWFDGYYYVAANYIPGENRFAYGRTQDFCHWEQLDPILSERFPGTWDERAVWAPHVFIEDDIYYMFFTGVKFPFVQSIMLATSDDPADPSSWMNLGMIFQPEHAGMVWQPDGWADCRDPMVVKQGDLYYLYYTGQDIEGGIIGYATAFSLAGPWKDWGRAIPALPKGVMGESPTVATYSHQRYLFYNDTSQGEMVRQSTHLTGPFQNPESFAPGWAHEIWQDHSGIWYTSYLNNYSITISPLTWDTFFNPPKPFIGEEVFHNVLPNVHNNTRRR